MKTFAGLALLLAGCSSSTEGGVSLDVVAAPATDATSIETDLGYRVEIEEGWWTISHVEIKPCQTAWQRVYDALIPSAHAHGVSTPTSSAVPVIESLFAAESRPVATLTPPATRYCSLHVTSDIADSDAEFIDEAPEMEGSSLRVVGSYVTPDGERRELRIASMLSFAGAESALELNLSNAGAHRSVAIEKDARRWFDGIDFNALDEFAIERAFVENFAGSITLRVE